MENLLTILSVPVITGIVFGAFEGYKRLVTACIKNETTHEKLLKIIPVLGGVLGAILGIIFYFAAPEIIAATNIFTALITGLASGLAATGGHQIFKQLLSKFNSDSKEDGSKDNKTDDKKPE